LHRLGAEVLAISPERMRRCAETAERDMLDFPLLSDHDSQIAERYGLAHELPECLRPFYLKLGHDLPQVNGTGNWRLPLTATFVIGQDRRVILSHVEIPTYRRMEPTEAIAALRALRKERAQVTETAEA
jgi:peroxiredoxin